MSKRGAKKICDLCNGEYFAGTDLSKYGCACQKAKIAAAKLARANPQQPPPAGAGLGSHRQCPDCLEWYPAGVNLTLYGCSCVKAQYAVVKSIREGKSDEKYSQDGIYKSASKNLEYPNTTLTDFVFKDLEKNKDKIALIDAASDTKLTYQETWNLILRVGVGLTQRGFKKGDVLLILSPNSIYYPIIYHGVLRIGGTVSTCNPAYTSREVAHQVKDSGASYIVTVGPLYETVKHALHEHPEIKVHHTFVLGNEQPEGTTLFQSLIDNNGEGGPKRDDEIDKKDTPVVLPYSSGTTGLSKGVMLTHYSLVANLVQSFHEVTIAPDDRLLGLLPMFHIYGQQLIMNGGLLYGATIVVVGKFDFGSLLQIIQHHRLTFLFLVPPIILGLAKQPVVDKFDLSSVKMIFSGAAPLSDDIGAAVVSRLKCQLRQGYGMTELSPVSHIIPQGSTKYGAGGLLLAVTEAKLISPEGTPVLGRGSDHRGELCVRGPQVMKGYLNNPEATKITIDADGFLHTGDVAYVDDEGYFYVVDRVKELIKYKGFQVPPAELEGILLTHPKILDCAVIPVPDEESGEIPRAYVVKKPQQELTEKEVYDFVKEQAAYFKWLRGGVEFIDAVPKSASGKILRRLLVDKVKAALAKGEKLTGLVHEEKKAEAKVEKKAVAVDKSAFAVFEERAEKAEQLIKNLTERLAKIEKKVQLQPVERKSDGKIVLGYWAIRGLAQPIRLLLNYIGLPFEDKRYEQGDDFNRDAWLSVKPTLGLALPNLPYLIDGDVKLTQSQAIINYIVDQYHPQLGGQTAAERGVIQMLGGYLYDFSQSITRIAYNPNFSQLVVDYAEKTLPDFLKNFNSFLEKSHYLAGDKIKWVDFICYELLQQNTIMVPGCLDSYPTLQQYLARFEAIPQIALYRKSKDFIVRPINNKSASFK